MTFHAHRLAPRPGEHAFDSFYVQVFWPPVLGPSAMSLWERLLTLETFDMDDLAVMIGIPGHGTFQRTLTRLVRYDVVSVIDEDIWVRSSHGLISPYHVAKLPSTFVQIHEQYRPTIESPAEVMSE